MPNKLLPLLLLIAVAVSSPVFAADAPRMSTDQLKASLESSDVIILDARGSWDWTKAEEKISGASRVDPKSVSVWSKNYDKEKTIVLYCA